MADQRETDVKRTEFNPTQAARERLILLVGNGHRAEYRFKREHPETPRVFLCGIDDYELEPVFTIFEVNDILKPDRRDPTREEVLEFVQVLSVSLKPVHPDIVNVLKDRATPILEAYRDEVLRDLQTINRAFTNLTYLDLDSAGIIPKTA
jgi:hypothetical protein